MRISVSAALLAAGFIFGMPGAGSAQEQPQLNCPDKEQSAIVYAIKTGPRNEPLFSVGPAVVGIVCVTTDDRFFIRGITRGFATKEQFENAMAFIADMANKKAGATVASK